MKEVEPHIKEESGTVKKQTQRFLIAVVSIISIAFFYGLFSMIMEESDEKAQVKKVKIEAEKSDEKKPVIAESNFRDVEDFEAKVSEKQKSKEREDALKKEREAMELARKSALDKKKAFKPSDNDESLDQSAYDKFKTDIVDSGKVRSLTDIKELASSEVRLSKALEDFEIEEKKRALFARQGKFQLKEIKQSKSNTKPNNSNKPESRKERIARIKAKAAEARKLKANILNGDFNGSSGVDDLTAKLKSFQNNIPKPRYSKTKTEQKRVVGATKDKAGDLALKGSVKLPTGTVIKAVLVNTIMSDYSNKPFKAQITQDIYDADYETILFPKGTIVDGRSIKVSNINEPIQARMGLTVNWFVLPNGNRVDFNKSASALDSMGIGAIKDDVDYHLLEQFLGVAAYAVISSGVDSNTSSSFTGNTNLQGDVESNFRKQLSPLASRYLGLVPTITLNTGLPISIYIENEMMVQPWGTIYDELL